MAAFTNVRNNCYLHRYQYYCQFFYESILTHGPKIVLPTYQIYNVTYLIKITLINGKDKLNTAVKYKINV